MWKVKRACACCDKRSVPGTEKDLILSTRSKQAYDEMELLI